MSIRPMHTLPGAFERLTRLYGEGEAAIAAGDLERAIELFTEGLAIDDHFRQRYVTMYAQRAFAQQRLGRLDDAIADYTRALELGEPPPNQAQYYFHRAMCFAGLPAEGALRLENLDKAVADHGRSIDLHPHHPGPYHLRARLFITELGRYAEALQDIDRALALRSGVLELHNLRGSALFSLERFDEAHAEFVRTREQWGDPYADYMLGLCAAKRGAADELFACMQEAVRKDAVYVEYFIDEADLTPFHADPRWAAILGRA